MADWKDVLAPEVDCARLQNAARLRLPDLQVLIAIFQHSRESPNDSVSSVGRDGNDTRARSFLLGHAVVRALMLWERCFPMSLASSRFDWIGRILTPTVAAPAAAAGGGAAAAADAAHTAFKPVGSLHGLDAWPQELHIDLLQLIRVVAVTSLSTGESRVFRCLHFVFIVSVLSSFSLVGFLLRSCALDQGSAESTVGSPGLHCWLLAAPCRFGNAMRHLPQLFGGRSVDYYRRRTWAI